MIFGLRVVCFLSATQNGVEFICASGVCSCFSGFVFCAQVRVEVANTRQNGLSKNRTALRENVKELK